MQTAQLTEVPVALVRLQIAPETATLYQSLGKFYGSLAIWLAGTTDGVVPLSHCTI